MSSAAVCHKIKEYLILTFACFVFAFCWEGFMIPNEMSAGGLMGLGAVIQYATHGAVTASFIYIAVNVVLIVISTLALGIGFGFKTIFCIGMSELALMAIGHMDFLQACEGNFFYIEQPVLVPVISGVLEAVGVGLIIKYGGSTGGTDIIAIIANKYWPVSLSKMFLVTDFIVICSMGFLPDKSFQDMAYGFEMMVTFSFMIDLIIGGEKSSFQLLVFSSKYREIADHIINELDRGVTVLHAQGWYTKKEKDVLLIIVDRNQLPMLTRTIKSIDSKAFLSVSKTSNVYGEGFEEIKTGIKKQK